MYTPKEKSQNGGRLRKSTTTTFLCHSHCRSGRGSGCTEHREPAHAFQRQLLVKVHVRKAHVPGQPEEAARRHLHVPFFSERSHKGNIVIKSAREANDHNRATIRGIEMDASGGEDVLDGGVDALLLGKHRVEYARSLLVDLMLQQ